MTQHVDRLPPGGDIGQESGTRMATHSPRARVEYMDLTANAPPEPAPAGTAQPGGAMR